MYMRFVYVSVQAEKVTALAHFYETRIAPVLRETKGCLFAGLVQSEKKADECISLTLWNTPEYAERYEHSGVFGSLLEEIEPFLASSSEWKVQLSEDLTLEWGPVKEQPAVRAYPVAAASAEKAPDETQPAHLYLRIVSGKTKPGRFEAFSRRYREEVIPALLEEDGCRYACLVRGMQDETEGLSVTLWDSKESADRYERSGRFDMNVERIRPVLSSLYQWKMALDPSQQVQVATSEDLAVKGYRVVTCESFE